MIVALKIVIALILLAALQPTDPPYNAQLITGYGSARVRDGVGALNFEQHTARPVLFLSVERTFPGMRLVGEVQITGVVTSSAGMTITAAVDDVSPDSLVLTMPCELEPPVGASATVSGTISGVSCPIEQTGCVLSGPITELGGNSCP